MNYFPDVRKFSNVGKQILNKRYLSPGETSWDNVTNRVTDYVTEKWDEKERELVRQMILNRYFIPNSPCLVNAGKQNGGLLACFVVDFQDTIEDIYKTKLDFALIAKKGGGCGTTLSHIRPKNSPVAGSTHGYSGGPVDFFDTICKDMEVMTQSGFRSMAMMGTMSVYHPDIVQFITVKETEEKMTTTNLSVVVDKNFIDAVKNDKTYWTEFNGQKYQEYNAREIFNLIVEGAWRNGEPGLLFFDEINENTPYKYAGVEIHATNPCFHPDTKIETVNGRKSIKDITTETFVYSMDNNGKLCIKKCSPSWVSRKNVKTLQIKMNNNRTLIVTPEHKLFSAKRGWVEAQNLLLGEEIVSLCRARRGQKYSGIKLSSEHNRAYKMEHRFVYEFIYGKLPNESDIHHKDNNSYNNSIDNLEILNHSEHARLTSLSQPNNHQVKGDKGQFISGKESRFGRKIPIQMPYDLRSDFIGKPRVISIEDGPITDVYDISVEETNNLIADYLVAHNCGEQPLPPNGSCNLGSIDISKFFNHQTKTLDYDKLELATKLSIRFLDSVITKNTFPTKDIEEVSLKSRQVGLGIMGFADYLLMREIAYGSEESLVELEKILQFMYNVSEKESIKLGEELGVPEWCQKLPVPRRNITLLSIAPTGTISLLAGCNSGIEPIFSEIVIRNDKTGTYQFENNLASKPYFRCAVSANGSEMEVTWEEHVKIQASAQKYVDSGVSKTINFPNHTRRETIHNAFILASEMGCKGITVYRNGSRKTEVLSPKNLKKDKCPVCNAEVGIIKGVKKCLSCSWKMGTEVIDGSKAYVD